MKKVLTNESVLMAGLVAVIATLLLTSPVSAQEEDTTAIPPQNDEQQLERQERVQERETKQQILQERIQDRIINLTANVVARLTSAAERFEQIISRIDARIIKLNTLGVETGEAEAALDAAKEKLRMAQEELEGLSSVREAISGDTPREAFTTIRGELRAIHALLKEAHAELRTVVALLKEAVRAYELPQGVSSAVTDEAREANTESAETGE